ncbi:nucleotidyltransferase domain-containing protein [Sulfurisphaera javensis]|uniref:Nucleotidyltransferase domain-containing protein n=1 Tax=Sulfurisphaera javensis TaxID=2049879 RepID=A0AAT9GT14_9CREN
MGKGKSALESQKKMIELAMKITERVASSLPLVKVYVFGSRARGDYLDISDIDLVFVLYGIKDKNVFERMYLLSPFITGNVDYIVLDESEENRLPKDAKLLWSKDKGFVDIRVFLSD